MVSLQFWAWSSFDIQLNRMLIYFLLWWLYECSFSSAHCTLEINYLFYFSIWPKIGFDRDCRFVICLPLWNRFCVFAPDKVACVCVLPAIFRCGTSEKNVLWIYVIRFDCRLDAARQSRYWSKRWFDLSITIVQHDRTHWQTRKINKPISFPSLSLSISRHMERQQ